MGYEQPVQEREERSRLTAFRPNGEPVAQSPKLTNYLPYLTALLAVAGAVAARWLLDPYLHDDAPELLFALSVMVAAWQGGLGPGLFATFVSIPASLLLFIDPRYSVHIGSPSDLVRLLVLFPAVGAGISFLSARLRRSQMEAQRSEELFRLLVQGASDTAIFATDAEGCIASWNSGAERITGYKATEAVGKHISVFFAPEDGAAEKTAHLLRTAEKRGEARDSGWRRRKNGTRFWAEVSVVALRDQAGSLRGFSTITRDLTERHEHLTELERSEETTRALIESAPQAILGIDPEGRIRMANAAAEGMFGYRREELIGSPVDVVLPAASREQNREHSTGWRNTGTEFPVEVSISRIDTRQGKLSVAFVADSTARKQAEDALRESEERLRLFIENAPAAMAMFDREMRYIGVSRRLANEYLRGAEEVIGRSHYEIFPECPERWRVDHRRGMAGEIVEVDEDHWQLPDGSELWMRYEVRPWRAADGTVGGIVLFTEDITERKRTEDALRESERHVRNVLDSLFAFVGLITPEGTLIEANNAPLEAAGISREDVIGRPFWEAYWWSYSPAVQERLKAAVAKAREGESSRYDVDVRMKDGELMAIDFMLSPMRDNQGRITHLIPSAVPITERKRAEEALARQLALTSAITDNATTALFIMDERQQCIFMNPAAEHLTGFSLDEVRGKALHDVIHHTRPDGSHYPLEDCPIDRALPQNNHEHGEEVFAHKDGHFYDVAFTASPVRDQAGRVTGTVIEVVDITERKRAEEERRRTEQLLDAVLESIPVAIVIAGRTGRLLRMNRASERILGPPLYSQSIEDYSMWAGYWPETGARLEPEEWPMSRALLHGEVSTGQLIEIDRLGDGERRLLELSAAPVRDQTGNIIGGVVACVDVTERARAEQALRASESRFRAAVSAVTSILWTNNARGEMEGEQPGWSAFTGQSYEEYRGYGWANALHPDDARPTIDAWQQAVAEGSMFVFEHRVRRRDGAWRLFSVRAVPVFGQAGQICEWVGVHTDITEERELTAALRESEERFRQLADNISQFAWMADATGWIFWYNRRWYAYTGTTLGEMQGGGWRKVHHPDHVDRVVERFSAAVSRGEPWEDTFPIRGKDGEWRWFLSRARPIRDESGEVVRWFGTNTDITEQLEAERALRESESQFRQTADSMPQLVWVARPDGSPEWYNQRWYEYTGATPEKSMGRDWVESFHPEDRERARELWQHSAETGEPYQVEYRCRRHDGVYRWFLGRALAIRDGQGNIVRWFGTLTDIHDQKQTETDLRRANSDLEQFAFSASHDLQEPLRNIAIYSQFMQRRYGPQLDQPAQEYLSFLVEGAQRMGYLISDLLAYTQAATLDNKPVVPANAEGVLRDVLSGLNQTIQETGASVSHDRLPEVAIKPVHVRQLFQNLVGNALKYRKDAEPPRVHISASREGGRWRFSVQDNGIGIDPQYHERIFGIFKRLHKRSGKYPGTGIGLAICQKIVDRYGGRIWVDSVPGEGSTFHFTLPAGDES